MTKVVTFAPRFILKNKMDEDLQFRQQGTSAAMLLRSKDSAPLHTIRTMDEGYAQLSVRLTGLTNEWYRNVALQIFVNVSLIELS